MRGRIRRHWALWLCGLTTLASLGGCGGGDGAEAPGKLAWAQAPQIFKQATTPDDRVLRGALRNSSLRRVRLAAGDLKLVDEDGRPVRGSVRFVASFVRSIYPPGRLPEGGLPEKERLRIGLLARIESGKSVPVTISWREPPGRKPPRRVAYQGGSLPLPR